MTLRRSTSTKANASGLLRPSRPRHLSFELHEPGPTEVHTGEIVDRGVHPLPRRRAAVGLGCVPVELGTRPFAGSGPTIGQRRAAIGLGVGAFVGARPAVLRRPPPVVPRLPASQGRPVKGIRRDRRSHLCLGSLGGQVPPVGCLVPPVGRLVPPVGGLVALVGGLITAVTGVVPPLG